MLSPFKNKLPTINITFTKVRIGDLSHMRIMVVPVKGLYVKYHFSNFSLGVKAYFCSTKYFPHELKMLRPDILIVKKRSKMTNFLFKYFSHFNLFVLLPYHPECILKRSCLSFCCYCFSKTF